MPFQGLFTPLFLEPTHSKSTQKSNAKGWIEIVCGSMFSGKTEELIRRLKRAKIAQLQVEIASKDDSIVSKTQIIEEKSQTIIEKEIEINLYNYLERIKVNNETINSFYNQNEIEKDYLKNIIKIDMKWSKLVRQLYESRLNVNLTEVNKELEKEQNNSVDDEKLKRQLIITEQNKLLNKFSATHLEKSKKKYLIKFL